MNQSEQFEKFAEKNGYDTRKTDNGYFSNIAVDIAWDAWQAAQAAKDAELQELRANLAKCREYIEQVEQAKFKHVWAYELEIKYKAAKEACGS